MRHGSLFSGIGGFDLAAEWMGWENVFHCEWNEFGKQILKYYWPKAISYGDITKTDFTIHRGTIDVLSGGFPCQPYSLAGKRKGKEDDRHLWPEMLRVIREIAPPFVVGENVYGLVNWNGGMVFDEVQSDLEAEGYEVAPVILPACGQNAPHRRERIWFVAYSASNRREREGSGIEIEEGLQPRPGTTGKLEGRFEGLRRDGSFADPNSSSEPTQVGRKWEVNKQKGTKVRCKFGSIGEKRSFADTTSIRLQGGFKQRKRRQVQEQFGRFDANNFWTTWQNFPTQSPICGGDDGLPTKMDGITFSKWRNESIKGYGNAVVPQIPYQIFKAIEQFLN